MTENSPPASILEEEVQEEGSFVLTKNKATVLIKLLSDIRHWAGNWALGWKLMGWKLGIGKWALGWKLMSDPEVSCSR